MAAVVKNLDEIRADQLREILNQLPEADTSSDSDYFVRASGVGSAVEGLYAYQQWQTKQIFPDSADPEYLLRHAALYGMSLKPAVAASGTLKVFGTVTTGVPSGLRFNIGALGYTTTSSGTIGADGTTVVTVAANDTGSASNIASPVSVQLMSVPSGLQSQATLLAMTGGLETETYSQLLSRLLDRLRNPPGSGKLSDYRRWALEVPGITAAYVYPHRTAVGHIDVVVVSGNALPSQDEVDAVMLNINLNRPGACRGISVFAPELVVVDHVILVKLEGVDKDALKTAITPQFASYYDSLVPGATVVKSKLEGIVSDANGVVDRNFVTPAGNVSTVIDASAVQWARLGQITIEDMA
ncbi:baseplate J/gp47 family protein [Burkholderia cenocepacia]|uniref:baseplate J/gp47 family protein n=1 Tax=Burkholderia cenocepacia TaxID=95486 RepID=UPI00209EEC13|nr:baseplate J/gp47 family protein [Burkholderia cenocepacia]MCO8326799.1 baseplate J/gp47 family protein [Burkholderia cenocepacia]MCO8333862.1 baseplate J/gp47 family protein [Burkholderia cenocepacia]MCO8341235.1 baseplate J/gp47 family protein [Burkholderia cenocepacia]MCO8348655.1 baseplate J/gp47 family protein [Burkholderia cenocepacia]MCO8361847.1 baseplate J/gp47 family protein [Burkholderia cenocepacia]